MIKNFTNEFVGGKEANDQEGPGIYFTSSWKNARSYGGYVYTVKLKPRKVVSIEDGKKASVKELTWLAKNAPNWQDHAQNWDENPEIGVRNEVAAALEYNDNPHQQFQQIWIDFYRNNPVDYVKNMVKLGYDLIYIPNRKSLTTDEDITHVVVLNPDIIEFIEMEDDRTEEEKKLNEVRKLVRKTLNENNLNDNFDKWFAGSKVINKDGSPLRVYHGSGAKRHFTGEIRGDIGIHFGTKKAASDRLYNLAIDDGNVSGYFLSIKKPIIMRDVGAWADFKDVADELLKNGIISKDEYVSAEKFAKTQGIFGKEHKVLVEILKSKGYDGIIYKNTSEDIGSTSYIVFDVSQIKEANFNTQNSAIDEIRLNTGDEYKSCHVSDLIRMDMIEEFFKNIESEPDYNIEEPEYDWLMDPHDGYPQQTYIQNDLANGQIIFWEGWSSFCWEGLYSKPEYKGMKKEDALKKIFRERTPRIAQEFNMIIEDADFFWHEAGDDDTENGYIMKIIFKKNDSTTINEDDNVNLFKVEQISDPDNELYYDLLLSNLGNIVGNPYFKLIAPNGKLAGVATKEMQDDEYAFDIAIKKNYRGKGLSYKLIDSIISDFLKEKNSNPDLRIQTEVISPRLLKVLEKKYGFETWDTEDTSYASHNNPKPLSEGPIWNQGGIVLIKGAPLENGTQRLYATSVNNLIEIKPGQKEKLGPLGSPSTPAKDAVKMAVLSNDFFRLKYDPNGTLKAFKIGGKNEPSLTKMLNFKNNKISIVLNNNKTPLHWESLQFKNIGPMLIGMDSQILGINNIDFFN